MVASLDDDMFANVVRGGGDRESDLAFRPEERRAFSSRSRMAASQSPEHREWGLFLQARYGTSEGSEHGDARG